jgi:hypothetical protein
MRITKKLLEQLVQQNEILLKQEYSESMKMYLKGKIDAYSILLGDAK